MGHPRCLRAFLHFLVKFSSLISIVCAIACVSTIFICWVRIESFNWETDIASIICGLIGICATFMVGWQIYSHISVKSDIDKINRQRIIYERSISKLDDKINAQNKDFANQKEAYDIEFKRMKADDYVSRGVAFSATRYLDAYICFMRGSQLYLDLGDIKNFNLNFNNMEIQIGKMHDALSPIQRALKLKLKINDPSILFSSTESNDIIQIKQEMESIKNYKLIEEKINKLESSRLCVTKDIKNAFDELKKSGMIFSQKQEVVQNISPLFDASRLIASLAKSFASVNISMKMLHKERIEKDYAGAATIGKRATPDYSADLLVSGANGLIKKMQDYGDLLFKEIENQNKSGFVTFDMNKLKTEIYKYRDLYDEKSELCECLIRQIHHYQTGKDPIVALGDGRTVDNSSRYNSMFGLNNLINEVIGCFRYYESLKKDIQ